MFLPITAKKNFVHPTFLQHFLRFWFIFLRLIILTSYDLMKGMLHFNYVTQIVITGLIHACRKHKINLNFG